MSFAPKTAIVTGSDSGIGRATAVALAKAWMDVGVTWQSCRITANSAEPGGSHITSSDWREG